MTQVALAASLDVSRETIRRWENGANHLDYEKLDAIGVLLGVRFEVAVRPRNAGPLSEAAGRALAVAESVIPRLTDAAARTIAAQLRGLETEPGALRPEDRGGEEHDG
jgi:transcriptional regulator with XRE-family HTH domain